MCSSGAGASLGRRTGGGSAAPVAVSQRAGGASTAGAAPAAPAPMASSSAPTAPDQHAGDEPPAPAALVQCVTNVQRYSLHDGGGIRTVAFLKGCPFRCPWCCNPENLSFAPEVSWKSKLCIGCSVRAGGACDANGCPCDTPPDLCPTEAKELLGRLRTSEDLADELLRDRVFFEESGGGVTLSGGECLAGAARQRFSADVLARCKVEGVSTAVETTLAVPLESPRAIVDTCDVLLVDFKIADPRRSMEVTRIDPAVRDANLRALAAAGMDLAARVVARLPIVPGYTDDAANVRANAVRARELGLARADILPFHQLGANKYDALGMTYECGGLGQLGEADVADAVSICEAAGLKVVVHGE